MIATVSGGMPLARRPPQAPTRAQLTPEQIRSGIARINRRIEELEQFDPGKVKKRWAPEVKALEAAIEETLAGIFGEGSEQFKRYSGAASLDHGPVQMVFGGPDPGYDRQFSQYLTEGKEQALLLLRRAVLGLEESLPEASTLATSQPAAPPTASRKVFIVHGHEDGPREMVARFLSQVAFEPVILHEQASQGRTIIEKVERHGDVPFAVVILTPDDEGSKRGAAPRPRARQNVVLELGYFIGRLGRDKVCALKQGDLELPSDYAGVVYHPLEGEWRQALARELKAAGFQIDWNLVMG